MISCPQVRKILSIGLAAFLASVFAAEPIAPEILHLARIQSKAKLGLSSIPAYTCSETMSRSNRANSRSNFHYEDVLKLEVAEIGGKELFAKAGESQFTDDGLRKYAGKGLIATGMFYHLALTVFGSAAPRFQYVGPKKIKGRRTYQYDFTISPLFANYHLNFNYHEAQCGFKGSLWADEQSLDLMRMHFEATDVPPELLLRSAITEIDYTRASLDGKTYLIPSSAEINTVLLNGNESRNQIRFSNCRKYGVESTITFQ
jgi:hypothetical protein